MQSGSNQVNINLTEEQLLSAPVVKCECGCRVFVPGVAFRKIPGFLVGAGLQPQLLPIQGVLVCAKCGELSPACFMDPKMKKLLGLNDEEA